MGEAWERVTKKLKSQMSDDKLRTHVDSHLRGVGECPNPSCNCVAILADYRPNIPVQFQSDELYAEPSAEGWAKVKKEQIDRSEFRAQLKADKYVNDKERIEILAVYNGEGKAEAGGGGLLG